MTERFVRIIGASDLSPRGAEVDCRPGHMIVFKFPWFYSVLSKIPV